MIALIGIGLGARDISIKAIDFIKSADIVIMDGYTSTIRQESIEFIIKETGKVPKKEPRSSFEENLKETIKTAGGKAMAILVIGDPLIATTHHIILDEAKRQGIETAVFHSSSIFSAAIGESGLDIYKFGPSTTVPFWSEHYEPTSFIDAIAKNRKNGEHTLLLLDIDKDGARPMGIGEALKIIAAAQEKQGSRIIADEDRIIVLADVGREGQKIFISKFSGILSREEELTGRTISLIVPAGLNFAEDEATGRYA
ncbi:MAG: diphthine synthase [Candidatus Micrarchaeaceae archaeon]